MQVTGRRGAMTPERDQLLRHPPQPLPTEGGEAHALLFPLVEEVHEGLLIGAGIEKLENRRDVSVVGGVSALQTGGVVRVPIVQQDVADSGIERLGMLAVNILTRLDIDAAPAGPCFPVPTFVAMASRHPFPDADCPRGFILSYPGPNPT